MVRHRRTSAVVAVTIILVLLISTVCALECVAPTTTTSPMTLSGCTVGTADLVVNVSVLGVGGTRTVTISDIVLDGYALVVLGWDAASPVDVARVDTGDLTIDVQGVHGTGRLIISGNFPNGTALSVASSSIVLNNSLATAVTASTFGCTGSMTVSSAICVSSMSVTYALQLGPDLVAQNSWDPPTAGSAYGGVVDVASCVALVVGDFGVTGRVAISGLNASVGVSASDVAHSASAVAIQVAANRVLGYLNISSSELRGSSEDASASATVSCVTWMAHLENGTTTHPQLVIGGGASIAVDTVRLTSTATAVSASALSTVNASGLLLNRRSTVEFVGLDTHVEAALGAVALLFPHPLLFTRDATWSVAGGRWHVVSRTDNATMATLRIVSVFPSLFAMANNNVSIASSMGWPTWLRLTGDLNLDAQVILYANDVTVFAESSSVTAIGILFEDIAIGGQQAAAVGASSNETLVLRNGGALSLTMTTIHFNGSAAALGLQGPSTSMVTIFDNGVLRYFGVNLSGSSNLTVFDMTVNRIKPQQLNHYTFVMGCFGVGNTFPVYIQNDYMSDDTLDVLTNALQCECTSTLVAFGAATAVGGTYPTCVANCTQASLAPYSWARDLCASPYFRTESVTITTRTVPREPTATTLTDVRSPTRRSLSLSTTPAGHTASSSAVATPTIPPLETQSPSPSPSSTPTVSSSPSTTKHRTSKTVSRLTPSSSMNRTATRTFDPSDTHKGSITYSAQPTQTHPLSHSRSLHPTLSAESTPSDSRSPHTRTLTHTAASRSNQLTASQTASQVPTASVRGPSSSASFSRDVSRSLSTTMQDETRTVEFTRRTWRYTASSSVARNSSSPSLTQNLTPSQRKISITETFQVPLPPFEFLTESRVLGFLTLALTSVSSVMTGYPSVIHTQFLAVVGQSKASGSNAQQRTEPMAHIVSPFWSYGSLAVAAGNMVVIVFVMTLHFSAVKIDLVSKLGGRTSSPLQQVHAASAAGENTKGSGIALSDSWVIQRFPELSYVIVLVFYQGVVNAAFNIFYHEDGPVFVLGTVCLLLAIALPLLLYWLLFGYLAGAWPPYRSVTVQHTFGWLVPNGYWSAGRVKRCFGRIFASTTDTGMKFTGYPLLMVLLVNAAANVHAANQSERDAQFGLLGLIFLAAAIFVMVLRPHRSLVTNVVFSVSFVCLMMLCVCLANEATNEGAANGVPVLIVLLEVILWFNGMYEVGVWYAEYRGVLHRARKAHGQGDESGMMKTKTTGVRADSKRSAGARSAFADAGDVIIDPMAATSLENAYGPPIVVWPEPNSSMPMQPAAAAVEMDVVPPPSSQAPHTDITPPAPEPLKAVASHTAPRADDAAAINKEERGASAFAPSAPEVPLQASAAEDDRFFELFAASAEEPVASKPAARPSLNLLQRSAADALPETVARKPRGPPHPPTATRVGKKAASTSKGSKKGRSRAPSSSSSSSLFSSSDDSDL